MIAKYYEKLIKDIVCEMIIVDEMPFSTVESMGFKKLFRVLKPRFKLPSRYTVINDCVKLYLNNKNAMKTEFLMTDQMVCLTTNTWTLI
jgi:hypothetical protein